MHLAINLATFADSWKVVQRAEALGYARAWFYDTQLLNADLFVAMGAAAMATRRIRLGTGVLVPSNRIAPVAANGLASLNALAPGRIDFGVATGSTARSTMGLGPVKQADLKEYVRIVEGLLRGETLAWAFEGKQRKIRFLNPEIGAINIADPIPLHVSAVGPKMRRLAAELHANWMVTTGSVEHALASIADMQAAWRAAGDDPAGYVATAIIGGCVLGDGEPYDSPRALGQAGPHATLMLHNAIEAAAGGFRRRALPPHLAPLLERYRAIYEAYEPADARYLSNHRNHLMILRPEERAV
jgi:5,10-methylenetetrahydromethanopterin reductase